jgi:ribonuclease HII
MFVYENQLRARGCGLIAGMDEAGRGPLAGPVTVGCCIVNLDDVIDGVNDSKKLSPKKREELYGLITEKAVAYSIIDIDWEEIDAINILNATKKAMREAVSGLSATPDFLLVDAVKDDFGVPYESVIHGDELCYSVAAGSILAKVHRDRLMVKFDEEYPQYGFARHKGYGTAEHIEALKKYGPCPIHRRTFIKNFFG